MFGMVWQTALDIKVGDAFSSNERDDSDEGDHAQDDNDANPKGFF